MKLTLKQKREIVRRFKAGESIPSIGVDLGIYYGPTEIIIRDYMNGAFQVTRSRKGTMAEMLKRREYKRRQRLNGKFKLPHRKNG